MKTYTLKAKEVVTQWHVLDATDQTLGRLASEAAQLLRGKHRPTFTPHMDNGDFVIVVNASKVKVTGNKLEQKTYYRHSGYPGGLKEMKLGRIGVLSTRAGFGSWSLLTSHLGIVRDGSQVEADARR